LNKILIKLINNKLKINNTLKQLLKIKNIDKVVTKFLKALSKNILWLSTLNLKYVVIVAFLLAFKIFLNY
jgi:hypothetical protein